jgi:hypothetical protein
VAERNGWLVSLSSLSPHVSVFFYSVDIVVHYLIYIFSILAILCAVTGTACVDIMSVHLLLSVDT